MRLTSAFVCSLMLAGAGTALGQSRFVEFRIVERQGQTTISVPPGTDPTTDNTLQYAVQGRVVGGVPTDFLGNFSFDIVANGERDSFGTMAKIRISNVDGTYVTDPVASFAANATVGRGGLAAVYGYLAAISPNFNGLINTSGGSFSNTPGNQEIGLVTGSPTGASLQLLCSIGVCSFPVLDPMLAATYLGAGGNFVDLYHFRYVVSDLTTARGDIVFSLTNAIAEIGTSLVLINGVWSPVQSSASVAFLGGNSVHIVPGPGAAAGMCLSALIALRRRSR